MITTGIIKQINIDSDDDHSNNLYNVEISILKTPISNSEDATLECTCCLPGGVYNSYKVGDVVYVGFVNNLLNYPVILGRIYKGLDEVDARSFNKLEDLSVSNSAVLPENTSIGDISFADLKKSFLNYQNIINQIDIYELLKNISGFDINRQQTLKNINGDIK